MADRLGGEAAARDQPRDDRVRVPHLACSELVTTPNGGGTRGTRSSTRCTTSGSSVWQHMPFASFEADHTRGTGNYVTPGPRAAGAMRADCAHETAHGCRARRARHGLQAVLARADSHCGERRRRKLPLRFRATSCSPKPTALRRVRSRSTRLRRRFGPGSCRSAHRRAAVLTPTTGSRTSLVSTCIASTRSCPSFSIPRSARRSVTARIGCAIERVEPERVLAWRSEDGNWVWTFILEPARRLDATDKPQPLPSADPHCSSRHGSDGASLAHHGAEDAARDQTARGEAASPLTSCASRIDWSHDDGGLGRPRHDQAPRYNPLRRGGRRATVPRDRLNRDQ